MSVDYDDSAATDHVESPGIHDNGGVLVNAHTEV